jgi:hypothetical protein
VNPSDESLLVCKLQEKGGEGIALVPTETREQSLLVLPRHGADFFQGSDPRLRQMEGVQTPVVRIGSAFNQSAFREIVQNRHEPAGMNSQPCRELLLARSGLRPKESQNSRICRCEFENAQSFSKLRGGMRS